MNLLAFVDPAAPVRLITGNESTPIAPGPFHFTPVQGIGIGAAVLLAGAVLVWIWRRRRVWNAGEFDREVASALARRLGLSRRDRATLLDLARNDGQHSPLDLLFSVKKLSAAASRRAEGLTEDSAREALRDLCLALDAQPPAFPQSNKGKAARGPRTRSGGAKAPLRGPARPAVVTPRLIDRRG